MIDWITALAWLGAIVSVVAALHSVFRASLPKRFVVTNSRDAAFEHDSSEQDRSHLASDLPFLLSELVQSKTDSLEEIGWVSSQERLRQAIIENTNRSMPYTKLLSECLSMISKSSNDSLGGYRLFSCAVKPQDRVDSLVRYLTFSIPEEPIRRSWCHAFTKFNFENIVLDCLEDSYIGGSKIWRIPAGLESDDPEFTEDASSKMMVITCRVAPEKATEAFPWIQEGLSASRTLGLSNEAQ